MTSKTGKVQRKYVCGWVYVHHNNEYKVLEISEFKTYYNTINESGDVINVHRGHQFWLN